MKKAECAMCGFVGLVPEKFRMIVPHAKFRYSYQQRVQPTMFICDICYASRIDLK